MQHYCWCLFSPSFWPTSTDPPINEVLPLHASSHARQGIMPVNHSQSHVRQPQCDVWLHNKLICMHAYALTHTLAASTSSTYSSALHSYLSFCKNHDFDIEPTEETLSFYTVYMSYHVKPSSVTSYLSGIQSQLELYFPNIPRSAPLPSSPKPCMAASASMAQQSSAKAP